MSPSLSSSAEGVAFLHACTDAVAPSSSHEDKKAPLPSKVTLACARGARSVFCSPLCCQRRRRHRFRLCFLRCWQQKIPSRNPWKRRTPPRCTARRLSNVGESCEVALCERTQRPPRPLPPVRTSNASEMSAKCAAESSSDATPSSEPAHLLLSSSKPLTDRDEQANDENNDERQLLTLSGWYCRARVTYARRMSNGPTLAFSAARFSAGISTSWELPLLPSFLSFFAPASADRSRGRSRDLRRC